jgi:hypothetical protein
MKSAIIRCGGFAVYVNSNGHPKKMAKFLRQACCSHYPWDPSRLIISIVADIHMLTGTLTGDAHMVAEDEYPPADFVYVLSCETSSVRNTTMDMEVTVIESDGHQNFSGPFTRFEQWAATAEAQPFQQFVGKIVQFKYNGGTDPGAIRTVRVEKTMVCPRTGEAEIGGYDLDKKDLSRSYREYLARRISGGISVLKG